MNRSIAARKTLCVSRQARALAAAGAVAAAVALPQLFHGMGAVSGLGTALGQAFLPMHLPILLVGLLAGPWAGLVAGLLAPAVSFALSGMPVLASLPFMMIEVMGYGLFAGLLSGVGLPTIGKVLLAQLAGRGLRAVAVLAAVYGFGVETVKVASIWTAVAAGLPGLVLQWALLPLVMFWLERTFGADA